MAGIFSLTLAISAVGLVLLLVIKQHELNTGRVMFGRLRPRLGHWSHKLLTFIEWGVPRAVYRVTTRVVRTVRRYVQEVLARAILLFEHYLERALHVVRRTSQMPGGENGGTASQFLQEVAAHKQKLVRRSSRNRAIFEE